MSKLGSGDAALLPDEMYDARKIFDVLVFPYAEVGRTDAAVGGYSNGFGEHGSSSANGARAQVNHMPVVGEPIFAGIFTHRRNGNAVTKRNAADFERIKQIHNAWM